MWNNEKVPLVYKLLQARCKFGPHFMPVLKIVYRSLDSHDKVIHMNFFMLTKPDDRRSISRNVASLNMLVRDV